MNNLSSYWTLCRISLQHPKGYEYYKLTNSQTWMQTQINLSEQPKLVLETLMGMFHHKIKADLKQIAIAGLCLRCHVSYPILKACKQLSNQFSGGKFFTYQELLPLVLNDDGKSLIVLDEVKEKQVNIDEKGSKIERQYPIFGVEILRTYHPDNKTKFSLENWAYLKTKQNPDLRDFLSEFGFQNLSDWALLNRIRKRQQEQLSERDNLIIVAFHQVYRRDRRQKNCQKLGKCPDPSEEQLQEMIQLLEKSNINLSSPLELLKSLRQIASQLRQYDLWRSRESLEVYDPESGSYTARKDLTYDSISETAIEQQEILSKLHKQLEEAFYQSLDKGIKNQLDKLQKSKSYAPFSSKFLPGLNSYYLEAKPLKEIASELEISWDKARRIFNPGDLLSQVRILTVQQLLDNLLKLAQNKGLTTAQPDPNYLTTLTEQIEAFADREIFQEAASEIRAGKNRTFESPYAQTLKQYLVKHL